MDRKTDKYLIGCVGLWLASHQVPDFSMCFGGSVIVSRVPIRALLQEIHNLEPEVVNYGCPKCVDAVRLIFVCGSQYKVRTYGT